MALSQRDADRVVELSLEVNYTTVRGQAEQPWLKGMHQMYNVEALTWYSMWVTQSDSIRNTWKVPTIPLFRQMIAQECIVPVMGIRLFEKELGEIDDKNSWDPPRPHAQVKENTRMKIFSTPNQNFGHRKQHLENDTTRLLDKKASYQAKYFKMGKSFKKDKCYTERAHQNTLLEFLRLYAFTVLTEPPTKRQLKVWGEHIQSS